MLVPPLDGSEGFHQRLELWQVVHHSTGCDAAVTVHGDGAQIRAWCYVTDMVSGVLACLERPEAVGQTFNIGNPRSAVTVYDLAQRIKRLTGCPGDIVFQPLHYADVELRIPNVEKAREQLGWQPQVELDDGLARTIAWYRDRARLSV